MKNILKLYGYIRDERNRLITTAIVSVLLSSAGLVAPLLFRYVINELSAVATHQATGNITSKVVLVLVGLAVLYLVDNIFSFFQERMSDRLQADINVKLRQRMFAHMMRLSIDYYEQTKVGETMIKVENALAQFGFWLNGLTQGTLTQLIQIVIAAGLLWYINLAVGITVTVLVSLSIAIQVIRIRRSRELRTLARQQYELAGGHFNETITHIATIRSSVPGAVPTAKYREMMEKARDLTYRQNNIEQYGNLARSLVNDVAVVAAVALIAWQALHGHASPGDVVAVALYLQLIANAVGPLGRLIVTTSQVETSVERITDLLETPLGVVDAPDAVELEELRSLEFRNVSFCYPGKKRRVLDNVSFTMTHGETLALVGPSGTGKTTITKLILRFYEPSGGEILINGRPVEQFTQESIRQHLGMVMQDVALFNDTVEANLQLANPEASKAEVRAAAAQAHADVFIESLPEKYQTMVGERGVKLSGGEKQRVAVARAILKQPNLIILDEATSALDSESERHVQAGLHELMADRMAVVIAHRLSTVMRADQILVLRNGKVVERGKHADLAERRGGLYAKLFKLQTEGFAKV